MTSKRSELSLTVVPAPVVMRCKPYVIPPKAEFIDLPLGNTERVLVSDEEAQTLNSILSKFDASTIVG